MGTVINFTPVERRVPGARAIVGRSGSGTVVILPVVRIERHVDAVAVGAAPAPGGSPRRRRRRATRP